MSVRAPLILFVGRSGSRFGIERWPMRFPAVDMPGRANRRWAEPIDDTRIGVYFSDGVIRDSFGRCDDPHDLDPTWIPAGSLRLTAGGELSGAPGP